jgi:hypothetical protein
LALPNAQSSWVGTGDEEYAMSILSIAQLSQIAANAGFSGQSLKDIVAIAMAESGGNTQAVNSNDPYGGSYGVLQINGAHFTSGTTTKECAFDPQCSFNYAYQLSNGGANFRPWGTFTNGSYQRFLPQVGDASTSSNSNPLQSLLDSGNITLSSEQQSSTSCAAWDISCLVSQLVTTDFFQRGVIVMVGIGVAIVGLLVLALSGGSMVLDETSSSKKE